VLYKYMGHRLLLTIALRFSCWKLDCFVRIRGLKIIFCKLDALVCEEM
jgi:hypothetical protein